jgi:hypothetical protein
MWENKMKTSNSYLHRNLSVWNTPGKLKSASRETTMSTRHFAHHSNEQLVSAIKTRIIKMKK